MEIHKTSSQAVTHGGGFIDSHWDLRKRQVLHPQARGNWIYTSQKTGHKPSGEADLLTNAQAMKDPALLREEPQTLPQVGDYVSNKKNVFLIGKVKMKVILSERPYLL